MVFFSNLFSNASGRRVILITLLLLAGTCCADRPKPVTQIYQFPANPFTDIENINVRSNGDLLLNLITSAATYILDPKQKHPEPRLLHTYTEANSTIGIVETTPDIFAVAVGNYSTETLMGVKGSFAMWKIDLSSGVPATATKVASIPEAESLNGVTNVPGSVDTILVADSQLDGLWAVNINTGHYEMAFQSEELLPTSTFPLSVNGIHTQGSTLYFTNSA